MQKSPEKKKRSFLSEYEKWTTLQSTYPLPRVVANLKNNFIDINADRICLNEWDPVISSLKVDDSLSLIAFRSCWQATTKEDGKKNGLNKRKPPIRSSSLTMRLAGSLKDCLGVSKCLECLVLQNIPFRENDVKLLAKGILKAHCLKYLSMERCKIGDALLPVIGNSLMKSSTITSVDFTSCGLTWKSSEVFAAVIKHQAERRNGEAWKASLRYRQPNFDQMLGLRRLTLCENKMGDKGATIFADVIKDDLWLKALDMQQCGITSNGATILKEALKINKTLLVVDLRRNNLIEYDILRSIIELVMVNAGGEHSDYPWLSPKDNDKTSSGQTSHKKSSFRRRCYNKNGTRRKSGELRKSNTQHLISRSTERLKNKSTCRGNSSPPLPSIRQVFESYKNTAVNAAFKQQDKSSLPASAGPPVRTKRTKNRNIDVTMKQKETVKVENFDYSGISMCKKVERSHSKETYLRIIDELYDEIDSYKDNLLKEQQKRSEAEKRVRDLEKERKLLQQKIEFYRIEAKKKEKETAKEGLFQFPALPLKNDMMLNDDRVLESIETSFKQFQQFLDMLKGVGLGDLCSQLSHPSKMKPVQPDESFHIR